jgi:hypothetical protein
VTVAVTWEIVAPTPLVSRSVDETVYVNGPWTTVRFVAVVAPLAMVIAAPPVSGAVGDLRLSEQSAAATAAAAVITTPMIVFENETFKPP